MNLMASISVGVGHELHHNPVHRWTVCVDFDGVLCDSAGPYHRNHFGPPIKQGMQLLRLLQARGWTVVILTARKETDSVEKYLSAQGFPNLLVTNEKVPAQAYIDDRAVHAHEGYKALDLIRELERRPRK
jgi:hypothetical protein